MKLTMRSLLRQVVVSVLYLALIAELAACGVSVDHPQLSAVDVVPVSSSVAPIDNPLKLVSSQQLDPRLLELTFTTPAMPANSDPTTNVIGTTIVRVLVPADYEKSSQNYPVLYLLHGAVGSYKDYTDKLSAEDLTKGLSLIVVMPDGGAAGEYTDWYNNGNAGTPQYETYHIDQLIPWVDAHFRTIAAREGRAVVGLSMGGFGAMSYAARHPDLFVTAAAFSGAVDTNNPQQMSITPETIWGPRASEEIRWRGSNPVDLAGNLKDLNLTMRTGNGMPGGQQQVFDPVEFTVHQESVSLHEKLNGLGIPHLWDDYGPGGHAAPYWQKDLQETLPIVMQVFASPPLQPSTITYTAIAPTYSVFGWKVALERAALEFSTLKDASVEGFALLGSGSALVTTPAFYTPGLEYVVTQTIDGSRSSKVLRADANGRMQIPVTLGVSNMFQQYTAIAQATSTNVYAVYVSIAKKN